MTPKGAHALLDSLRAGKNQPAGMIRKALVILGDLVVPPVTLLELMGKVKEIDGCWIWQGSKSTDGQPRWCRDEMARSARLLVWEAMHGKEMPDHLRAGVLCDCGWCVHPDHIVARKSGEVLKGTRRPASIKAKIAATKRAQSKFSTDLVESIKQASGRDSVIARKHGMNQQTVMRMRNGQIWRDYDLRSPFSGLA